MNYIYWSRIFLAMSFSKINVICLPITECSVVAIVAKEFGLKSFQRDGNEFDFVESYQMWSQGLEAKAKDTKKIRGQSQGLPFRGQTLLQPRTKGKGAIVLQEKKGLQKFFSGTLQKTRTKNKFSAGFLALSNKILTIQEIVLSLSR